MTLCSVITLHVTYILGSIGFAIGFASTKVSEGYNFDIRIFLMAISIAMLVYSFGFILRLVGIAE